MNKINEKELHELFNGIKNEDSNSFTIFYENYFNLVYRIVFSMLKNKENSEDITQVIFSKIYQLPKDKLPEKYEASWLYKVSKNEVLQSIRKQKNETNIEEVYDVCEDNNDIDEILDQETYRRMVEGLNDKEKEIISLKVLSQFTFKKIGQVLNMPTATVQWIYYKSINSLKLSISSLAGFIIALILGVATTKRDRNIISEKIENGKITKTEITDEMDMQSESYTKVDKEANNSYVSEVDEKIVSGEVAIPKEKVDKSYLNIGFYGVSIIFFIIFLIFIKKYQQKRKVKASKS